MTEEVTLEEYGTFLVSYKGLKHINNPKPTKQFMNLSVEEVPTV
jgi:nucleoid DNA-binding protein